jgi:hypothetical protein
MEKTKPMCCERAMLQEQNHTDRASQAMKSEPNKDKEPEKTQEQIDKDRRKQIRKEIREAFKSELLADLRLKDEQVSEAVELYYEAQSLRIRFQNKRRSEGPGDLVDWFNYWLEIGEKTMYQKLQAWVEGPSAPGEASWAYAQAGIGPVIAAGLAAHIDVTKAKTVSGLWKFAGLAPGFDRPTKGTKLPYNARLKVVCWKAAESFVKVSSRNDAIYGQLYAQFKTQEIKRNESGAYKAAAAHELATKKFKAEDSVTKKRLLNGMLSDAHLHSRAKRRAVKIFLAHYWTIGQRSRGLEVREPYSQQILGHDGIIEPAA